MTLAVRGMALALVVTLTGGFVVAPAAAEPSPETLRAKARRLADKAEKITEQYNGKRIRLRRAQRSAHAANRTAKATRRDLDRVLGQVRSLAATRYINGATPDLALLSARNPQDLLDASAMGRHLSDRDTALIRELATARTRHDAALRAAKRRVTDAKNLVDDLADKKRKINKLVREVRAKLPDTTPAPGNPPPVHGSGEAAGAVKAALSQLGVPYSWGGGTANGPSYGVAQGSNIKGFDCSGLTLYAYAQVGITLPHYTGAQYAQGRHVSQSELQPGDLVFFYSDLHHMGMYIGNGKMVHAPQTGDVVRIAPMTGRPFAGATRPTA